MVRTCNKEECNNYRGISLLSVLGKIYRILNERMINITDKSVGDEHGDFGMVGDVKIRIFQ